MEASELEPINRSPSPPPLGGIRQTLAPASSITSVAMAAARQQQQQYQQHQQHQHSHPHPHQHYPHHSHHSHQHPHPHPHPHPHQQHTSRRQRMSSLGLDSFLDPEKYEADSDEQALPVEDIFKDVALDFNTAAIELTALRELRRNPFPSLVRSSNKAQLNVIMSGAIRRKSSCRDWYYLFFTHVLHPMGTFRIAWELHVCAALVYTYVEMPLTWAFEVAINNISTWYGVVNFLIDLLLMLDIFFNFRTGYFEYFDRGFRSEIITTPRKIAKKYIKTWFFIDLITAIPLEYALEGETVLIVYRIIRFLRLLRLIKIWRFWSHLKTYNMTFRRLLNDRFGALLNVGIVLFVMIYLAHVVACIWFILGKATDKYTWIDSESYRGKSKKFMYIASLYWSIVTLTTTGFGDITPQNQDEMAFATVIALLGACLFAYLIGQTGVFVTSINRATQRINEKLNEAYDFCQLKGVSDQITQQVLAHTEYYYRTNFLTNDSSVWQTLPRHIQLKIIGDTTTAKEIRPARIVIKSLFGKFIDDDELLGLLALRLKSVFCVSHLFEKGDYLKAIYIHKSGYCVKYENYSHRRYRQFVKSNFLLLKQRKPLLRAEEQLGGVRVRKGDVFGGFRQKELKKNVLNKAQFTIKCEEPCEFYVLNESDVLEEINRAYNPDSENYRTLIRKLTLTKYADRNIFVYQNERKHSKKPEVSKTEDSIASQLPRLSSKRTPSVFRIYDEEDASRVQQQRKKLTRKKTVERAYSVDHADKFPFDISELMLSPRERDKHKNESLKAQDPNKLRPQATLELPTITPAAVPEIEMQQTGSKRNSASIAPELNNDTPVNEGQG